MRTRLLPCRGLFAALAAFGFVVGAAGVARAQAEAQAPGTDNSFEVQLFQGAIGPRGFFTVDSAAVPAHKQFHLGLITNYQRSPFSIYTQVAGESLKRNVDVVRNQATSELTGAIGLVERFQLGFAIPMTLVMDGEQYTQNGQASGVGLTGKGIGDVRLEGKALLTTFGPSDEFHLAMAAGLTLPTGNQEKFLGDKTVTGRLRAISEFQLDDFRAGTTIGVLLRKPSDSFQAKVGSQVLYGLAVDYRVHRQVSLIGEFFGRSGINDFFKGYVDENPNEIDAGMRVGLPSQFSVTVGAGAGISKGIGSPKARIFLALAWAPDFRDRDEDGIPDIDDRCPDAPEDLDGYKDSDGCPELDNDGDGILDTQDKCPNDAEDLDQFQDEDGCPELDNDKDGIPDLNDPCPNAAEDGGGKRPKDGCPTTSEDSDGDGIPDGRDKCPDEPEDRDGFQDYDGCPEPDNDGDNIPDAFDACPNEAEDADGFEDADGCPDLDNDKDGIPDTQDRCPMQPETLNGIKDDDGCPDAGLEIVTLGDSKIEMRERIVFTGPGKQALSGGSTALVNLVALVMKGHSDIARLRVEVYSDGGTKEETQARAESVVNALVGMGIEAHRLKAVGMGAGPSRVEFIIESRTAPKKAASAAAPAKE